MSPRKILGPLSGTAIVWSLDLGLRLGIFEQHGTGAAYAPATVRWREVEPWLARLLPVALWTGQEAIVWGGIASTETGLLASSSEGGRLCLTERCPKR